METVLVIIRCYRNHTTTAVRGHVKMLTRHPSEGAQRSDVVSFVVGSTKSSRSFDNSWPIVTPEHDRIQTGRIAVREFYGRFTP